MAEVTSAEQFSRGERLAVVGLGLIGGSIAAAVKTRNLFRTVIGVGRSPERLQAARDFGIVDEVCTDLSSVSPPDLVVVCTPPDRIHHDVLAALQGTAESTLVTDAGSIKRAIVDQVRAAGHRDRFIPAHPLAGSHQTGFEYSDPDIFQNRLCILSPDADADPQAVERVRRFWQAIGMRTRDLNPDDHDRLLAATSHLPHLTAAALAAQVGPEHVDLAAGGFRDSTRIAAGDPQLWSAILSLNADQVGPLLDGLIGTLQEYRRALEAVDTPRLKSLLTVGRQQRALFHFETPAAEE